MKRKNLTTRETIIYWSLLSGLTLFFSSGIYYGITTPHQYGTAFICAFAIYTLWRS